MLKEFKATVYIDAKTKEKAEQVLGERLGYDEDYGFPYQVSWNEPVETSNKD